MYSLKINVSSIMFNRINIFGILLFLIIILGIFQSLIGIYRNKNLQFDEARVWKISTISPNNIILGNYPQIKYHPPLFYLFIHYWKEISASEAWLRIPSILTRSASIFILYQIISKLKNKKAGLIASLLFATSSYHFFWSIQGRVYEPIIFLSLIYFFLFLNSIYSNNKNIWFFWTLIATISFFVDYSFIWTYLSINIFYVVNYLYDRFSGNNYRNNQTFALYWLISNLFIFITCFTLFYKIYLINISDLTLSSWINKPSILDLFQTILIYISGNHLINLFNELLLIRFIYFLSNIITFIFILYSLFTINKHKLLAFFLFFVPLFSSFMVSQAKPIFLHYNIMISSVGLISILSLSQSYFKKFLSFFLIMNWIIINSLTIVLFLKSPSIEDWDQTFNFLTSKINSDYKIIFYPPYFNISFQYYNNRYKLFTDQNYELVSNSFDQTKSIIENAISLYSQYCIIARRTDLSSDKSFFVKFQKHSFLQYVTFPGIDIYCTKEKSIALKLFPLETLTSQLTVLPINHFKII